MISVRMDLFCRDKCPQEACTEHMTRARGGLSWQRVLWEGPHGIAHDRHLLEVVNNDDHTFPPKWAVKSVQKR